MSYLKLVLFWLLGTFVFFIFIATSMLFSRITTLEAVTIFEFKMYVKILEKVEENKLDNLMAVANVLAPSYLTKDGIEINNNYFPIAVVLKDKCIENGVGNSNICTNFNNINELENFFKNLKYKDYKKENFYIYGDKTFIYRKINNDLHLVGLTGKYLDSEKRTFIEFVTNDWANYFLKIDSGKSGLEGLWNTWNKSKESFYIIFITSSILLFLVIFFQIKNRKKFNALKEKLNSETKKIEKLNEEYDDLNYKKQLLEEKLNNELDIENEQQLLELNNELEKLKKEITISSKKEDIIFDKLKKQSNYLSDDLKSEELVRSISEIQTIKQLWTREFKWDNRLNLESNITTELTNIPFTLTIAFILFENQFIDKMAKKSNLYERFGRNLESKIDVVCEHFKLSDDVRDKFHEIRKARNKWFHYGKKPDSNIIKDLLSVLDQYDIKADILI